MGYDLESKNNEGYFRANIFNYPKLLQLGYAFGWMPEGTIPPADYLEEGIKKEGEKMGYFGNAGQIVSETDAKNLAEALDKAIKEIPTKWVCDNEPLSGRIVKDSESLLDVLSTAIKENDITKSADSALIHFAGEQGISYVKKFASFCRNSKGFEIY